MPLFDLKLKRSDSHITFFVAIMLCTWFVVSAQSSRTAVADSIGRVSINFRINRQDIDSTYADNARGLRKLYSLLDRATATPP